MSGRESVDAGRRPAQLSRISALAMGGQSSAAALKRAAMAWGETVLSNPDILNGGADGDTAVTSWHEVDFGGAEDLGQSFRAAEADGGHLAFCWDDAGMAGGEMAEGGGLGPCSSAVDEVGSGDRGRRRLSDDPGGFGIYGDDGRVFYELDSGGDCGGGKRGAQISRVEAGFVEVEELFVLGLKCRYESLGLGAGENATFGVVGGLFAGDGQDRGLGPQRNFLAGELFY